MQFSEDLSAGRLSMITAPVCSCVCLYLCLSVSVCAKVCISVCGCESSNLSAAGISWWEEVGMSPT